MQRQYLGSPGSKINPGNSNVGAQYPADEVKAGKPIRSSSRSSSRTVHLIPILTLLCFLILYLISHDPSPSDLPIMRGIERIVVDPNVVSVSGIALAARGLMEEKRYRNRRLVIS